MIKTRLVSVVSLFLSIDFLLLKCGENQHSYCFFLFPFIGVHYGGSVPASKVMDGLGDAIFAYEMNDEPVSRIGHFYYDV
jgi:hypothetical protein